MPLFRKHTEEEEKKIGLGNKGKVISEKQKEQLRVARLKQKDPRLETEHSIESKLKMSLVKRGSKSPTWKGGISPFRALVRSLFEYRQWRFDCFTRDNFTCVLCGNKGGNLNADHYPKSFSKIMDEYNILTLEEAKNCIELWNINNDRTLCIDCHKKTDTFGGKNK
jgi:hypothetical protein